MRPIRLSEYDKSVSKQVANSDNELRHSVAKCSVLLNNHLLVCEIAPALSGDAAARWLCAPESVYPSSLSPLEMKWWEVEHILVLGSNKIFEDSYAHNSNYYFNDNSILLGHLLACLTYIFQHGTRHLSNVIYHSSRIIKHSRCFRMFKIYCTSTGCDSHWLDA